MAKQQEDGTWLASCPICTWRKSFATKKEAQSKLSNHISIRHQEGSSRVRNKKVQLPARDMPPQLPAAVKES